MIKRASIILVAGTAMLSSAHAARGAATVAPGSVRHAFGVGLGVPTLLHVDYQGWFLERSSIEVNLTPMLAHNVLVVSYNHHLELARGASSSHNLLLSGGYMGVANFGYTFQGIGVRAGYEHIRPSVGISGVMGAFVTPMGNEQLGSSQRFLPQLQVTVWLLRRRGEGRATRAAAG
ncbi:MAG: hypothetical protein VX265_08130 [Myxococcota bacterium]|nr:hypothetical protein [Myxococcota bacterium]